MHTGIQKIIFSPYSRSTIEWKINNGNPYYQYYYYNFLDTMDWDQKKYFFFFGSLFRRECNIYYAFFCCLGRTDRLSVESHQSWSTSRWAYVFFIMLEGSFYFDWFFFFLVKFLHWTLKLWTFRIKNNCFLLLSWLLLFQSYEIIDSDNIIELKMKIIFTPRMNTKFNFFIKLTNSNSKRNSMKNHETYKNYSNDSLA